MNVFGPYNLPSPSHRIQPVDDKPDQESAEEKRRRRAKHGGRTWNRREKADVEPTFADIREDEAHSLFETGSNEELFEQLTTLEEKVAQLCFYQTEAVYDTSVQQHVELLIQAWQIGGLVFTKGQYKRQAYLIERYQELSKTPLLIGNDLLHGLSFYFEGDVPELEQKRFSDLGKAVMGLNRRLGVNFQLDRDCAGSGPLLLEEQRRLFRSGIRQAQGIVGRLRPPLRQTESRSSKAHAVKPSLESLLSAQPHDFVGSRQLTFLDLSEDQIYEEKLVKAFKEPYDVLVFGANIQDAIRMISKAVKSGRIAEAEIDRRLLKVLALKNL